MGSSLATVIEIIPRDHLQEQDDPFSGKGVRRESITLHQALEWSQRTTALAIVTMSCWIALSQSSSVPKYLIVGVCWVSRKVTYLVGCYPESHFA